MSTRRKWKYRPELSKVQKMVWDRLDTLILDGVDTWRTREELEEEWTKLCSSIGIERVGEGFITKNEVVMRDPMPGGEWLEMSEDTVLKILALGWMP